MNRRAFLKTILATGTAPAFVKFDSLMGLYVPKKTGIILDAHRKVQVGDIVQKENGVYVPAYRHDLPLAGVCCGYTRSGAPWVMGHGLGQITLSDLTLGLA